MLGLLFLLLALNRGILPPTLLRYRLGVLWEAARQVRKSHVRTRRDTYVSLVPLAEGSRINLDDSTLDKGVGPNKLVVGRIIDLEKTEQ